jgi:hypothetical protein
MKSVIVNGIALFLEISHDDPSNGQCSADNRLVDEVRPKEPVRRAALLQGCG